MDTDVRTDKSNGADAPSEGAEDRIDPGPFSDLKQRALAEFEGDFDDEDDGLPTGEVGSHEVRKVNQRVGTYFGRAWKPFAKYPFELMLSYLVLVVSTLTLPFLGGVYRLEGLLQNFRRVQNGEGNDLGLIILPTKAKQGYETGFWHMLGSWLRTDLTVGILLLFIAVFALIPAAVLYPVSMTLQLSLMGVAPSIADLAMLPVSIAVYIAMGAITIALFTYSRLSAQVHENRINSGTHLALFTLAFATMKRHSSLVVKAALVPAGVGFAFGVAAGIVYGITSYVLPVSQLFFLTGVFLPLTIAMITFTAFFSYNVAQALSTTVEERDVQAAASKGISISSRLWAFFVRIWNALLSNKQTNYLVLATFAASAFLLALTLLSGWGLVSYAQLGVFAVVAVSFTVLAARSKKEGSAS